MERKLSLECRVSGRFLRSCILSEKLSSCRSSLNFKLFNSTLIALQSPTALSTKVNQNAIKRTLSQYAAIIISEASRFIEM